MLESALEQLLLQFLAPYVDGISKDKLHLGVFSGSLDLRDLKVKPDALALLGWEGLRVRSGSIKLIKLAVPWSKLYTGKVKASIECLHLEVENIADGTKQVCEALAEMRAAKQKAIEVRMDQLREQAQVVEDGDAAVGKQKGYGVRLARKVLNNITVILSDVSISFLDSRKGLACGLEFPSLDVLSTDQTFRERQETEVVQNQGLSMYKLLRLRELGIRMSPAGSSALSKAEYVLSPISASLQLAHEPTNQLLRVRLEVATEAQAEVVLTRSQVKHLRSVQAEVAQEVQRLHELLVPPGDEKNISENAAATLSDYGRLYERSLLQEWQLVGGENDAEAPLQPRELERKQLLEDGLSSRLLARERWKVRRKVEAVNEEVARRQTDLETSRLEETRRGRGGLLARFRGRKDAVGASPSSAPVQSVASISIAAGETRTLITAEEKDQLLHDLEDDSKVESVDLPQRLCFEFVLGHMALLLIDDRRAVGDLQRQLLHLELKQANWKVDFNFATDHRGQDSAEWRTEIAVSSFHALHAHGALMKLHERSVHGSFGDSEAHCRNRMPEECARLVLDSLCQKEQNLLKLCFDFMPVEVHMLPGIVELLLEFWRAPEFHSTSSNPAATPGATSSEQIPLSRGVSRDMQVEDRVEMAKQWLEAHEVTAKDVAEKVYDRIPDKVAMEVRVSSPILFVPVAGLGTSMISLGMLHIRTPQPCEYRSIDLEMELNHTGLRADSLYGERFEMVQPVPVRLSVEYRGSDEQNAVHCQVKVKELSLSLAPQAVQILLATPTSFFQILYPNDVPSVIDSAAVDAGVTTRALATVGKAAAAAATEDSSPRAAHPSRLRRAAVVAGEVLGSDGGELLEAVARRAQEVRSKQFKLDLTMDFNALSITMADSIQPFMRWRMELLPPGLILHQQKEPNLLTVNAGVGTLEVDVLNTRSGCWEPFLERCRMGLEIERKASGSDPDDGSRATHFIISGQEPVRVNLTPTAVRRAAWILPLFAASLSSEALPQADCSDTRGPRGSGGEGVKYRVVSLCDEIVELKFISKHTSRLVFEVPPTGCSWRSLDEFVLPHFATAVVAMLRGSAASEPLPLERCGAVTIPGSGFVAELLAPEPSHRLLLLATPLRVHNQSDLPILVRIHDAAHHEVLPIHLESSTACDATLLGFPPPPLAVVRAHVRPSSSGPSQTSTPSESHDHLELKPNMCCSVPAVAIVRAQGFGFRNAHVWISIKPAGVQAEFSMAVEVGAAQQACAATCRPPAEGTDASARALHFLCDSNTTSHPLPAPIDITTIAIRPALVVLNALPIGDLTLRYSRSSRNPGSSSSSGGGALGGRQGARPFYEAFVPRFTRLNIYDLAPKIQGEGVTIIARMEGEAAPWSPAASISSEALFQGDAEATQPLPLRQRADGAAAGVTLEPIGCFQVRVACPAWFSDRSGLNGPLRLALTHRGRPLPHEAGLTLLHAEHTEESCDLVLQSSAPVPWKQGSGNSMTASQRAVAREVRLPPSWDVIPWQTPCGSYIFCVQSEDVIMEDVLGAQCQVLTLRPRLVLSNASDCTLEVTLTDQHSKRQIFQIPPSTSVDHHWAVQSGQEDSPGCSLYFRPIRDPPCQWSGVFVCNDAAAGTVPFALAALGADASPGHRASGVEVWSAEVAPFRGALSVQFKQGSDFVAVNLSARMDISMALRPSGCDGTVADVPVPFGAQVPYGWMHPFKQHPGGVVSGTARRAVEVVLHFTAAPQVLERRFKVKDVRRTQRVLLRGYDLALVISRVGPKTLLSLVDQSPSASVSSSPSSTAPALSVFALPQRQLSGAGNTAGGGGGSSNTTEAVVGGSTFKLDVKFSCLSISIVEEPCREVSTIPRDLLYLHLELIRLEYRRSADDQSLKFAISEAQVDCQLPGRADGHSGDKRRDDTLALPQHERPAVIFANCADGDRAFLTVVLHRGATSSRDMVIPFMDVAVDAIDLTIDDGWLDPFVTWCRQVTQTSRGRGMPFAQVSRYAGKSVLEGYEPPPLPSVVQVESLHISPLCLTAWCALKLKSVSFLPPYLHKALRLLSLSGNFTLDGAALRLEERRLPPHRGSLADFVRGLASEYNTNLLKATAGILGKSSVVNLPRTGASYLADSVGLAAAEAASLVNLLTFDEDYVAHQRQLRSEKRIRNVGDGLVEAGKSLAQGLEGMMDVWRKPMEGAKTDGMGGFFAGVGKGLAGTFVKPISKVGQAISDVGSGIAAQVGPDSASQKRRRARPRIRLPRLLFTELGVMRPWCELEAELLRQLGDELLHGVEEVVPLTSQPALRRIGSGQLVLLLFRRRLLLVEIKMPVGLRVDGQQEASSEFGVHRRRQQSMSIGADSLQAMGSRSTSSVRLASSNQSLDVFEALDESAVRLFSHALKPLNTVVYGVQDLEQKMMAGGREVLDCTMSDQVQSAQLAKRGVRAEFSFRGLRGVEITRDGILQLEEVEGRTLQLPLEAAPLGPAAREALAVGFRTAIAHPDALASWEQLRAALAEEQRQCNAGFGFSDATGGSRDSGGSNQGSRSGAGQRVLEVFEVERLDVVAQKWRTPFMPLDSDLSWRWLDSSGCRHPHLNSKLTREQAAAQKTPPCGLDVNLFKPMSQWVKDLHVGTDKEGWRYGMAWNSSTWEPQPGLFDGIRKRRWTRTYA